MLHREYERNSFIKKIRRLTRKKNNIQLPLTGAEISPTSNLFTDDVHCDG